MPGTSPCGGNRGRACSRSFVCRVAVDVELERATSERPQSRHRRPETANTPAGASQAGGRVAAKAGGVKIDQIKGRAGNDVICAGDGKDHVVGGSGNDRIFGEAGNDHLIGNQGNDRFDGGPGKDKCLGGGAAPTRRSTARTSRRPGTGFGPPPENPALAREAVNGSDGTRTRGLRRDRPDHQQGLSAIQAK